MVTTWSLIWRISGKYIDETIKLNFSILMVYKLCYKNLQNWIKVYDTMYFDVYPDGFVMFSANGNKFSLNHR